MSSWRMAALSAGLLLVATFAGAVSNSGIRIKVLDSETRSATIDGSGVPKNCDGINYDAYCNNSKTALMTNTLLVQVGNEPPFHVACLIDSRWSRCTPLPVGETFDARKEKHGLTVYYVDDKGKARSQFYKLVASDGKAAPPAVAVASQSAPAPHPAAPVQNSLPPAPASPPAAAQRGLEKAPPQNVEKVRCNFTSTPPDADITVDGHYVGNTPSEISLSTGTHLVVIAKVGFAEWKRELTIAADSVVNVTASLQTQP